MTIPTFTLAGYAQTISHLLRKGYELRSFREADPVRRHLVLRHDVDQSIEVASEMAALETANGWFSSWFILLRSEMYNPFSTLNTRRLREMADNGHAIGLHLDATLYPGEEELDRGAQVECQMLEDILAKDVEMISFHRPAPHLLRSPSPVAGRLHTYMPRFMTQMGYCSDSRGEWRHGHVWEHPALDEGRALQLLTHAIWWVGPETRQGRQRLEDELARTQRRMAAELAANSDVWSGR